VHVFVACIKLENGSSLQHAAGKEMLATGDADAAQQCLTREGM